LISRSYEPRLEVTSMSNLYERERVSITEEESKRAAKSRIASLSDSERQIIALVVEGLNDRQIANSLTTSEIKIREHLKVIFDKLKVSDRLELVVYVYYHSLAPLPH
jgi:DNA-binding NarL/FixJ family response regulator